jgi:hypothetical protein
MVLGDFGWFWGTWSVHSGGYSCRCLLQGHRFVRRLRALGASLNDEIRCNEADSSQWDAPL